MVRTGGLEPPLPCEKQIFVPLRLSPPPNDRRLDNRLPGVRGLDYPFAMAGRQRREAVSTGRRRRPSSLYTVPLQARHPRPRPQKAWLGIGLGCPLAFPEFERFCTAGFPAGTPNQVCCVYRFRHVRIHARCLPGISRPIVRVSAPRGRRPGAGGGMLAEMQDGLHAAEAAVLQCQPRRRSQGGRIHRLMLDKAASPPARWSAPLSPAA